MRRGPRDVDGRPAGLERLAGADEVRAGGVALGERIGQLAQVEGSAADLEAGMLGQEGWIRRSGRG